MADRWSGLRILGYGGEASVMRAFFFSLFYGPLKPEDRVPKKSAGCAVMTTTATAK